MGPQQVCDLEGVDVTQCPWQQISWISVQCSTKACNCWMVVHFVIATKLVMFILTFSPFSDISFPYKHRISCLAWNMISGLTWIHSLFHNVKNRYYLKTIISYIYGLIFFFSLVIWKISYFDHQLLFLSVCIVFSRLQCPLSLVSIPITLGLDALTEDTQEKPKWNGSHPHASIYPDFNRLYFSEVNLKIRSCFPVTTLCT